MWHDTADRQDTNSVKKDYLTLKGLAEELCKIVESTHDSQREIEHRGFPYFPYMVGLFLLNQLHYLEDLLALIPNRSVEVIARTMVEGFIKLKWVEREPESRAVRWFSFSWVQEWKYAIRQESRGLEVDNYKQSVLGQIKEGATDHLYTKGLAALEKGSDLDPFKHFKHDWTGFSTFQLAQKTSLVNLYTRFFDPLNDWVHWSPKGFIKSADVSDGGTQYTFRSYYQSTACLIAGISSLLGCLKIWDMAYSADYGSRISEFERKFESWAPN